MSTSSTQTTNHKGRISDFPFIAHDGTLKARRQIPTFVRAHVMERYHRERRAKKGIKDEGNQVWSQHQFVVPVGQGQILRWDDENVCKVKTGRKKTTLSAPKLEPRATTRSRPRKERSESPRQRYTDETKTVVKTEAPDRARKFRQSHLNSFKPKDALEECGPRMIQILDQYYGASDLHQKRTDPWFTIWMPFAFSDPVLFHASFSKFSLHVAAARGTTDLSPDLLKHKGLAMQQISERIRDPATVPTDQMIAAVLCLIGTEMLGGDRTAVKAHLKGLRQMVAVRGGVQSLASDGVLICGYLSYEYVIATMALDSDDEDWYPASTGLAIPDPHAISFPVQSGIFTLSRTLVDPTQHGFSAETLSFLSVLCDHLCVSDVFVGRSKSNDTVKRSLESLIEDFNSKDQAIKCKLEGSSRSNNGSQLILREDHVLQSLILTARIQFPHLSNSPSLPTTTTAQNIKQLKHHLSKTPVIGYWRPLPGALLWCLMVGTGASKDSPERPFFLANMVRLTCGTALENLEGVRIALEVFHRLAKQQQKLARALVLR